MSSREEAPSSLFSSNTNDSDWSDINTEDEDEEDKQNTDRKLSIDLVLIYLEQKNTNACFQGGPRIKLSEILTFFILKG